MAGLLNLTDGDTSGFDPLPPGKYQCALYSIEMSATKPGGKLPAATPMLRVQYSVLATDDGEPEVVDDDGTVYQLEGKNRRFFDQMVVPPKELDGEPYKHYEMMNGQIIRFFMALGVPEETIRDKKGFNPDFDEFENTPCLVTVGRDTDNNTNPVKGVKPMESAAVGGLL